MVGADDGSEDPSTGIKTENNNDANPALPSAEETTTTTPTTTTTTPTTTTTTPTTTTTTPITTTTTPTTTTTTPTTTTTTPTTTTTTPITTTTTPIPKKDLEASISANVTKGSVPLTINFTAEVDDAEVDDSLIAEYEWEVHEDENYMYGRSVEYTYKEAGEYTVTLTLTPKDTTTYFKTKITKTITVTQEKLEAIISASEDEGGAPLKITFTGTAKGNPVSWEWDFDDGSSLIKNQTKVEHSFTKAGVYNVRLTIRNETGSTASTTKQIEVTEKPTTTTTTATPTKTTAPTTAATTVQAVKSASPHKNNSTDNCCNNSTSSEISIRLCR